MEKQPSFNRIFIDIDSLLDTRQGILSKFIDETKLADFIASESYNFRTINDFSSIVNMKDYETIERNPTKDVIFNSTMCYLFNILKKKLANLEQRNAYHNEVKDVELLINIYPYRISEQEQDLLIDAIFKKLNTKLFIKLLYVNPLEISPLFLKNNDIVEAFIYDSTKWLDTNLENIQKSSIKLHDIRINFPAIYKKELTEEMTKKISEFGFKDVFSALEYIVSQQMIINFLPIIYYNNIIVATSYIEKFNQENRYKSIEELFPEEIKQQTTE